MEKVRRMQFFRYKEDRLPVAIFTGLLLLDLGVYFYVENIWFLVAWLVLGIWPKGCICAWNHHHQHVHTFKQNFLNRLLEVVYTFHTGITTNMWVLHHNLGHHLNYLDQTKDESGWKRKDGKTMGVIEYTLTIALTGPTRAYRVGKRHPKYQTGFITMGTVNAFLLGLLIWNNWVNGLLVFALPMLIGYVVTCWATYSHHAGLDTEDHHEASYNIMHKWYNIMTGNLGYHTAHHMKQGLHWSKLPEYHETIKHKIPKHLYCEPNILFSLLPSGENETTPS